MNLDDAPQQPDDSDDSADPYWEWVFSEAHDIEYWVVREGRLVPAERGDLERIAEWERERAALPRLHQWERARKRQPARGISLVTRFVSWCAGLGSRAVGKHPGEPKSTERVRMSAGDGVRRHRSDVAPH